MRSIQGTECAIEIARISNYSMTVIKKFNLYPVKKHFVHTSECNLISKDHPLCEFTVVWKISHITIDSKILWPMEISIPEIVRSDVASTDEWKYALSAFENVIHVPGLTVPKPKNEILADVLNKLSEKKFRINWMNH